VNDELNYVRLRPLQEIEFFFETSEMTHVGDVLSSREIASAIKKLLDCVTEVSAFIPGPTGKQALDQRKREFVKYSKKFSNTLKEYFKEGQYVNFNTSSLHVVKVLNQKSYHKPLVFLNVVLTVFAWFVIAVRRKKKRGAWTIVLHNVKAKLASFRFLNVVQFPLLTCVISRSCSKFKI
jgi:hypothetical protein